MGRNNNTTDHALFLKISGFEYNFSKHVSTNENCFQTSPSFFSEVSTFEGPQGPLDKGFVGMKMDDWKTTGFFHPGMAYFQGLCWFLGSVVGL